MSQRSASWSLHSDDARQMAEVLDTFLSGSRARCALLVDRNGQLVVAAGDQSGLDPTSFASLAAADFSANDQLASLLGEQEFSSLFHQGEQESMYLADVQRRLILVALFGPGATLGLIRIKARQAVRVLGEIVVDLFERPAPMPMQLEPTWLEEAESEIDRLFGSL